ncbi:MAG: ABC transporter permease [Bacteroidota bacterium]
MMLFDRDNWAEIFYSLKKNKLRTFFTAFGVFWGIFMLVIMLGAGKGLENGAKNGMGDLSTNSMFMWGQTTTLPYKGFDRGRRVEFNNYDTEALYANIKELEYLAPQLRVNAREGNSNVVRKERAAGYSILGNYPELNLIDPSNILKGRYINKYDIEAKRKVAVLGIKVRDDLFNQDENPIGEVIQINGVSFTVVGVQSSKRNGNQAERENSEVTIPFTTLQQTFNYGNRVGWYSMTTFPQFDASKVLQKAKDLMKDRHSISPDDDRAIGSFDLGKEFSKMTNLFIGIDTLIWIVGIGTLFAGIVGVSNIMLIVVKERTKEIGVQRALGATPQHVRIQIMMESIFLTTIAGYIGLIIGVGIIELADYGLIQSGADAQMFTRPEVDFNKAITALIILIFSGAIAGIVPAQRAVKLKPIEALRDE